MSDDEELDNIIEKLEFHTWEESVDNIIKKLEFHAEEEIHNRLERIKQIDQEINNRLEWIKRIDQEINNRLEWIKRIDRIDQKINNRLECIHAEEETNNRLEELTRRQHRVFIKALGNINDELSLMRGCDVVLLFLVCAIILVIAKQLVL